MLTIERLKQLLDYHPESGMFRHKTGNARFGSVAGKINEKGHRRIMIDTKLWYAHRLAWMYVHGAYPIGIIDHLNGDPDDNRIANLREVESWENSANIRRHHAATQSGMVGVTPNGNGWMAQISHRSQVFYLGTYPTKEEAHSKFIEARKILRGEFHAGRADPLPEKDSIIPPPLAREAEAPLTRERLAEIIDYNPLTGDFQWKAQSRFGLRRDLSKPVMSKMNGNGYVSYMLEGKRYLAHHLAWFFVHGLFSSGFLDHINGNRSDNRIANLREATPAENARNGKGWVERGRTGRLKGAYPSKLRWAATIRVNRKLIYLGQFPTEQAAHEAYVKAAKQHFGEFARAGVHSDTASDGHTSPPPTSYDDATLLP